MLKFYSTQNFGHFGAALSKDVQLYTLLTFGQNGAPSLVTLLNFLNVINPEHLNT